MSIVVCVVMWCYVLFCDVCDVFCLVLWCYVLFCDFCGGLFCVVLRFVCEVCFVWCYGVSCHFVGCVVDVFYVVLFLCGFAVLCVVCVLFIYL